MQCTSVRLPDHPSGRPRRPRPLELALQRWNVTRHQLLQLSQLNAKQLARNCELLLMRAGWARSTTAPARH